MGFFSWKTQDSGKSIANVHTGRAFTVYMKDNKGNVWKEESYGGYGDFGGKDFYVLLAEMNGLKTRDEGLLLSRSTSDGSFRSHIQNTSGLGIKPDDITDLDTLIEKRKDPLFPNLVEDVNTEWKNQEPANCEYQGFFYLN